MSNRVTVTWIQANKDNLIHLGLVNGIGPKKSFVTKCYHFFLRTFLDRDKSFFYEASIYHDVYYYVGNTRRAKIKADFLFFLIMLKLIWTKLRYWQIAKMFAYFWVSIFFYLSVVLFGHQAFNWGTKITKRMLETQINRRFK